MLMICDIDNLCLAFRQPHHHHHVYGHVDHGEDDATRVDQSSHTKVMLDMCLWWVCCFKHTLDNTWAEHSAEHTQSRLN